MSFHKAIEHGKEKRKEWVGKNYCKSVDTHCQNHGGRYHSWQCPWCEKGRQHTNKKNELKGKDYYE